MFSLARSRLPETFRLFSDLNITLNRGNNISRNLWSISVETEKHFQNHNSLSNNGTVNLLSQSRAYNTGTYMHDPDVYEERLFSRPKRWPKHNEIIHKPEDGPVERYYCHYRDNIKYSPKKMFYVAGFLRGMNIDEAIKQLTYIPLKGATIVKEVLQEAQEIAVREHNFEFKSNMWIAESFATKGVVFRGFRKHARMRYGEIRYFHCHYFVRLVEGTAPDNYQRPVHEINRFEPLDANKQLNRYIEKLRKRRIDFAL